MWKWILGIALVLVVLCGVGGYFVVSSGKVSVEALGIGGGKKKGTEVRVEPAAKGTLIKTVSAPGMVDPKVKVEITAQVSARITALPFKEGDDVKEGDVVVRLDAEDLIANLEALKASLKADEARLEGAKAAFARMQTELNRTRQLFETKDRSQSALELAEAEFLQAQSAMRAGEHAIEIARANIRRAERDVQNTVISSPIDGTIIKVNNEVGELVLGTFNNIGQTIIEIADMNRMIMRAEVDESSVAQVEDGQKANIFINAYPGKTFTGTVDHVKQQRQIARDGKGYFETEIVIELPEDKGGERETLLAGLTANTDIQVETQFDVIKVPSQAVMDRRVEELPSEAQGKIDASAKNKSFARVVYRIVDGKAKAVPVVTGSSDLTHTVILSGLAEGEEVITGPYKVLASLKDGQVVTEIPAPGSTPPAEPGDETNPADATASAPASPPA